ncbi:MAG: tRNA glutamyl-Q(34) synthetase GluQRS [Planctomycetes bacterium]|nr:tRNA glutamyl-Q(34) synthetase GluQRS [Planctomycetota bacterium]
MPGAGPGGAEHTVVGRLAPSPTGVLHLGNARTFLLAWLSVRARGGVVRLRIEDIDGPRVRPEATAQTLEDLAWLGLDWQGEVWIQSQRLAEYRAAAGRLVAAGLAYPCVCSRKEVEEAASAPHESGADGPVYPGTCRGRWRSVAEARAATGKDAALRFVVTADAVPFVDRFLGPQAGAIRGDFVIAKRDGGPAYQLAVVVDDAAMGVTEVLRADDLLPSTPRQLLLYRALGLTAPEFAHTPLVVGADGLRLAKRHGDTALRSLRAQGVRAERVVGHVAALSGLVPAGTSCRPQDLLAGFDLRRVPRAPAVGVPFP